MRSLWQRPGATPGTTVPVFGAGGTPVVKAVGVAFLLGAFVALWFAGVAVWG